MIKTEIVVGTAFRCALEGDPTRDDYQGMHGPVVAMWDAGPLGLDALCKPCLDLSLDYADSMNMPGFGTIGEPDRLTWVMTETQHWCGRHWWPAVLCDGWLHGFGTINTFGQGPGVLIPVPRRAVEVFHPMTRGIDITA